MSIIGKAVNYECNDEQAYKWIELLFPLLPHNDDFTFQEVYLKAVNNNYDEADKLTPCIQKIESILRQDYLLENSSGGNSKLKLTANGRQEQINDLTAKIINIFKGNSNLYQWNFTNDQLGLSLMDKPQFNTAIGRVKTILISSGRIVHTQGNGNYYMLVEEQKDTHRSTINVGGDFTGQLINQSSVNDLISDRIESTKTTNPIAPNIKSRTSKVIKFIVEAIAALAGLIAIYEFILKHILKTPSLF